MTINKSKRYNNIKLAFGIGKGVLSFILILLFVLLGYSSELLAELKSVTENNYLLLLLFTIVIGVVSSIIFAPVNYYVDFYLEHKYDLSNQTFWKWITENFKETLVGSVIGLPILILFFWVLNLFGQLWWLPFALAMFVISVVLAKLVPVIILPIFYKITPIDNEELKARIVRLADNAGMKVENVFKFDMSKNTKKANAAFTGLGKTKRIILGDTLLENYSEDEIETVIAHELGHYKHNHIVKNIIISTIFSFATFFLIAQFYSISINWFGFESIQQIDALPVLVLWSMLVGLVLTPITNVISRKFEYEADEYAISSTRKKDDFINTLNKLTDQNLGDKEPHPLIEWFFYSHPSINKRITYINSLT